MINFNLTTDWTVNSEKLSIQQNLLLHDRQSSSYKQRSVSHSSEGWAI